MAKTKPVIPRKNTTTSLLSLLLSNPTGYGKTTLFEITDENESRLHQDGPWYYEREWGICLGDPLSPTGKNHFEVKFAQPNAETRTITDQYSLDCFQLTFSTPAQSAVEDDDYILVEKDNDSDNDDEYELVNASDIDETNFMRKSF